ncbi:hypothetical protein [Sphingopyxis sp. L1A2A]|nr:hypothetical protein [Sphingopyxis sp. L1A2A]
MHMLLVGAGFPAATIFHDWVENDFAGRLDCFTAQRREVGPL